MNRRYFTKLAALSPLSLLFNKKANASENNDYCETLLKDGEVVEILFYSSDRENLIDTIIYISEQRLGTKIPLNAQHIFKKECYRIYKKHGRVLIKVLFKKVIPPLMLPGEFVIFNGKFNEPYYTYEFGMCDLGTTDKFAEYIYISWLDGGCNNIFIKPLKTYILGRL